MGQIEAYLKRSATRIAMAGAVAGVVVFYGD